MSHDQAVEAHARAVASGEVPLTLTIQTIRGLSTEVGCTSRDNVGTVARLAARDLKQRVGPGDSASLATLEGVCLNPSDRIGLPAQRTFHLVIVGGTP